MSAKERRFYIAEYDLDRPPFDDYKFLNIQDIRQPMGMPRTTRIPTPYSKNPVACGLPVLNGKPEIAVGLKSSPPLDANGPGFFKMISPRAKHLLETIDGDAFEFLECDTQTRGGKVIESFWLVAIKRLVIEFDEENSVFERALPQGDGTGVSHNLRQIYILRVPDLPDKVHAFHISRFGNQKMIWDDVLVDAWIANGLTGLEFTPLQEPSDEEFARNECWTGGNRIYWHRRRGLIK